MKRRTRKLQTVVLYQWIWRTLQAAIFFICVYGFVSCTRVAIFKQAHFAPESEHPWDFEAEGWLAVGMVLLALFLMSLRSMPQRWLRKRVQSRRAWRDARAGSHARPISGKMAKRRRVRSGYNKNDDT